MTYGPAAILMVFSFAVTVGVSADSPGVLVPFLLLEVLAIALYATHVGRVLRRRR